MEHFSYPWYKTGNVDDERSFSKKKRHYDKKRKIKNKQAATSRKKNRR